MDWPIKPETSLSYDFGLFRRIGKSFDMRVAGNYINTKNYFVTDSANTYYNDSYAYQIPALKFYGAELECNWTPTEKLVLFGNYSYLKNDYNSDGSLPYAMALELPPRNKGKFSVRYDLPFNTRISFDAKIYGKRKTERSYSLDRYVVADIGFNKVFASRMTAGVFIKNMFDTDYQQVYGYPSPGVTWGFRFKVSTEKTASAH
jgi:outer membrane receptor protein involved in Fe transport